ncbi:class C beta-lactamase [Acinetobacter chinensis]|uniref:Beta-lactamase n=1 Tax=Acinetobacter chinensis TaxID=2004650 RepID=A0A3B7M1W1_9GAMM|nr:class C beta-lactamase [Acinetobacter chinensis]AXY58144.1 class C beta-lactamase [Acinetobacter chinensis]
MLFFNKSTAIFCFFISCTSITTANTSQAGISSDQLKVEKAINQSFQPLMKKYDVAGMAIGVIYKGKSYEQYSGLQSIADHKKVNKNTLFELGSVSKIFTAIAGTYAQNLGKMSPQDYPAQYLPALKNSEINQVTLLELATYTSGNLPLQFPDQIQTDAEIIQYFQNWHIKNPIGKYRQYSNPSIGLFGELTAKAMKMSFKTLSEQVIYPQLDLKHTYIQVPKQQQKNYAFGYNQKNQPIRVTAGAFDTQAYGVKSNLADLLHFINLNIDPELARATIKPAIKATHTGYYKIGDMTQALGWEKFTYPATLQTLQESNSERVVMQSNPVEKTTVETGSKVFHKTGSTNGFGSYIIYIPEEKFGLVMLMNKKIPNPERIKAAYEVFHSLH